MPELQDAQCHKCHRKWQTTSKNLTVTCPNCGIKTKQQQKGK